MDKIHAIDFEDMTYGELEIFEDVVGVLPSNEEEVNLLPKSKFLLAMGLIAARRTNPDATLDDMRALPVGHIVLGEDEDTDPNS